MHAATLIVLVACETLDDPTTATCVRRDVRRPRSSPVLLRYSPHYAAADACIEWPRKSAAYTHITHATGPSMEG